MLVPPIRSLSFLAALILVATAARAESARAPAGPALTDIFDAFPTSTTLPANGRVVLFGPLALLMLLAARRAPRAVLAAGVGAAVVITSSACMTDVKETSCLFSDILVSGEDLYCPDATAPDDCEALNEAIVAAAVECGGGAFSEEQLREALDEDGALQSCDDADATSLGYEACLAHFTDPAEREPDAPQKCEGLNLAPVPDFCVGAVLQGPA